MAARQTKRRAARGPWLLVAAAVVWNLVSLRATTLAVAYLDDSSVHAQMVRFATARLRAGDLPLTSWFPYLGLGSAQFLHYQSLPAMLTGVVGGGSAVKPTSLPRRRWRLFAAVNSPWLRFPGVESKRR
jgi:hypothetical protein